jgi:hypothetical protein
MKEGWVNSNPLTVHYGTKQVQYNFCIRKQWAAELEDWCFKNFKPQSYYSQFGCFYFVYGKDATAFAAQWI